MKAIVAKALIMWSNELEKWWHGGCVAELYGRQPRQSSSQWSFPERSKKWAEQNHDTRASWMTKKKLSVLFSMVCLLSRGCLNPILTFPESLLKIKRASADQLANSLRGRQYMLCLFFNLSDINIYCAPITSHHSDPFTCEWALTNQIPPLKMYFL